MATNGKKPDAPDTGGGISPAGAGSLVTHEGDLLGGQSPHDVLELAAACVRFAATALGIEPDFSPETLSIVDQYVRDARAAVRARPETLALTAHAVGAYLGEVVKRSHRCWWRVDGADPGAWRLEFESVLLAFYPVQVAYTTLTEDEEDAFSGFELSEDDRDAVVDRLALVPGVSEEDYYLPSTRLEVLDIVLETLVTRQAEGPVGPRSYRPDDYD